MITTIREAFLRIPEIQSAPDAASYLSDILHAIRHNCFASYPSGQYNAVQGILADFDWHCARRVKESNTDIQYYRTLVELHLEASVPA